MVLHSGNKSLHGWFSCQGADTETHHEFFKYAVSLGADRATWRLNQLVRLPDGQRDNGKRQQVLYWDPEARMGEWKPASELPSIQSLNEEGDLTEIQSLQRVQSLQSNRDTDAVGGGEIVKLMEPAIARTTPAEERQNDDMLFSLARELKGEAKKLGKTFSDRELAAVAREWCARNLFLRYPFDYYLGVLMRKYDSARVPAGESASAAAFERAKSAPLPPEAEQFEDEKLRLLVKGCRELQELLKPSPFFLSCRDAGKHLGISHETANVYLYRLQRAGVIREHRKGTVMSRRATRYFYNSLCPIQPATI
jgi:hypothetical protein